MAMERLLLCQKDQLLKKTYRNLEGHQAVSPFSAVPITAKGKLLNESSKQGDYSPSNHLKNLASTASQYIKDELGVLGLLIMIDGRT